MSQFRVLVTTALVYNALLVLIQLHDGASFGSSRLLFGRQLGFRTAPCLLVQRKVKGVLDADNLDPEKGTTAVHSLKTTENKGVAVGRKELTVDDRFNTKPPKITDGSIISASTKRPDPLASTQQKKSPPVMRTTQTSNPLMVDGLLDSNSRVSSAVARRAKTKVEDSVEKEEEIVPVVEADTAPQDEEEEAVTVSVSDNSNVTAAVGEDMPKEEEVVDGNQQSSSPPAPAISNVTTTATSMEDEAASAAPTNQQQQRMAKSLLESDPLSPALTKTVTVVEPGPQGEMETKKGRMKKQLGVDGPMF